MDVVRCDHVGYGNGAVLMEKRAGVQGAKNDAGGGGTRV